MSAISTASKDWRLVVGGYSTAAVGLVLFLTINGASGIPTIAIICTAMLIAIGLLFPAAGIFQLRRSLGPIKSSARYGYALQAFGLLALLFGVVLVVVVSSLSGFLLSAVFVVAAGVLAISGAVLLRAYFISADASNARSAACLIFATALIFSGVGLIVASNIEYVYLISQIENTVYIDIGATVSACGCIIAAYSFYILHNRK